MEQAHLLAELGRLFVNTRNIDEFEFVNVLISFNGMGDQHAMTHLFESRAYISDMKARYSAAENDHSRARLGLHMYCHIFEMDELYNILGNLLRIAANQQLRYLPDLYTGRDDYYTPTEKFHKLRALAEQSRIEGFIDGVESLYLNEIRNGFVHSAYSLVDDDFILVRGNGIPINGAKHHSVSINQFLLPLIDRAIDFIDNFFKLIDDNKMSYRSNKVVQGRMPDPQPIMILGDPETGLIGFQTFVGSWIKIQPGYGSTQFAQAMNIRFDTHVENKQLNERLEAYIEKLTPHGRDFNFLQEEIKASGDKKLLTNLAKVYYNYGNNASASKSGKPQRQQEAILKSAIERYDQALAIDPSFSRAYHNKGTAILQLAKLQGNDTDELKKEALALFEKTLAIDSNMYEAWLNSARVIADLSNNESDKEKQLAGFYESLSRYQKSIAIHPHDPLAFEYMAWVYRRLAHLVSDNEQLFKEGISAYEMASKLNPSLEASMAHATFVGEYGQAFDELSEQKAKDAIEMIENARKEYGNNADISYCLGNKYHQLGQATGDQEQLKTALQQFELAVQLDASHIRAMNNAAHTELSLSLYEKDDAKATQQLNGITVKLDKVLELDPSHEHAWYNLGLLHLELAKRNGGINTQYLLDKAAAGLHKAEAMQPGLGNFDLARAYALMGNKPESIEWLKKWQEHSQRKWESASFKEDFDNLKDDQDFIVLTAN